MGYFWSKYCIDAFKKSAQKQKFLPIWSHCTPFYFQRISVGADLEMKTCKRENYAEPSFLKLIVVSRLAAKKTFSGRRKEVLNDRAPAWVRFRKRKCLLKMPRHKCWWSSLSWSLDRYCPLAHSTWIRGSYITLNAASMGSILFRSCQIWSPSQTYIVLVSFQAELVLEE